MSRFVLQFVIQQDISLEELKKTVLGTTPFKQVLEVVEHSFEQFLDEEGKSGFLQLVCYFQEFFDDKPKIMEHYSQVFFKNNEEV